VEQSTAAARSLTGEAGQLSGLVSRFTLAGGHDRAPRVQAEPRKPKPAPRARAAGHAPRPMTRGNLAVALAPSANEDWSEF
jgi:methyl-accepting chemotaxis protein